MARRTNTITRFIEDMVDDTKGLVDDVLDRAKDLEVDMRDAVEDVVDDERVSASSSDVAGLQAALAELTAKVNQLAELQLADAKKA